MSDRDTTTAADTIRVLTYNVHGCVGWDGRMDIQRIARVIARQNADVIALQEVDAGRRHENVHQAHAIAEHLEMHCHFHPVYESAQESSGNAILSRYPVISSRASILPGIRLKRLLEPRGIQWVVIEHQGRSIQVLNTHLSLWGPERKSQMREILSAAWMSHPDCRIYPTILCGDFNAHEKSAFFTELNKYMTDTGRMIERRRARQTWVSRFPIRRLDYIFINRCLRAASARVVRTELEIEASDHLPLAVDLRYADGN